MSKLKPQRTHMHTNQTAYPMALIYIDFYGPVVETEDGYRHVLTIKDIYTRYVWLIPCKDQTTQTVLQKLEEHIFKQFGLVDSILSDNAKAFSAKRMNEICKALNIDNKHILPFNANVNSSERVHRTLGEVFRAPISNNQKDWQKYIPVINLALNSAKSRATNY